MQRILDYLSLIEKEEHEKMIHELQTSLWKQQEYIFAELQETREHNRELTRALSEMVYIASYSPDQRCIEKLANEKTALFHPLLSTPELRKNNKRTLDLLLESTKPARKTPLFSQIISICSTDNNNNKETNKRVCRMRECLTCKKEKQIKCYQQSHHICNSCMYRKDHSRRTVKSCDEA